jgi:hypothetical protein
VIRHAVFSPNYLLQQGFCLLRGSPGFQTPGQIRASPHSTNGPVGSTGSFVPWCSVFCNASSGRK